MSGSQRSVALRCLMMSAAALFLITGLIAAPVFTRSAAAIPFGTPAFAAQWNSIEPKVPNFWGPAYQNVFPEQYQEATGAQRYVQYFDKARMEQTTASGPVTNGLLTVELMSGQRQFGDNTFVGYPPATIPIVGDPINTFPTYASLAASVLPAKVSQIATPNGNVYNADGTLTVNSQLAAFPGAAFGSYQADPGGRFAHNIPLAFWSYLSALPTPWQTAMGFPLTEAVWVSVTLNGTAQTWVLVQPFERRVLSYTPTNPPGFQVEMGNIGQHYFQWRYMTNPGGLAGPATATPLPTVVPTAFTTPDPCATPTPLPTSTGTPTIATSTPTATPVVCTTPTGTGVQGVEIVNVRLVAMTDTTFSFAFNTNLPATTYIRYGIWSGFYTNTQDISTSPTKSHTVTLSGLDPGQTYYYILHATSKVDSIDRYEDYFTTTYTVPTDTPVPMDTPTPAYTSTPIPTNSPTPGPTASPTPVPTRSGPPPVPTVTQGPSPTPKGCPATPGPVPCRP